LIFNSVMEFSCRMELELFDIWTSGRKWEFERMIASFDSLFPFHCPSQITRVKFSVLGQMVSMGGWNCRIVKRRFFWMLEDETVRSSECDPVCVR
jgi:hypothetical protein